MRYTNNNLAEKIYNIIKEQGKFLTLSEIYSIYERKYDVSEYTNFHSAIRTAIYRRCMARDLRNEERALFFSTEEKRTIGNKYGIIEWYHHRYIGK